MVNTSLAFFQEYMPCTNYLLFKPPSNENSQNGRIDRIFKSFFYLTLIWDMFFVLKYSVLLDGVLFVVNLFISEDQEPLDNDLQNQRFSLEGYFPNSRIEKKQPSFSPPSSSKSGSRRNSDLLYNTSPALSSSSNPRIEPLNLGDPYNLDTGSQIRSLRGSNNVSRSSSQNSNFSSLEAARLLPAPTPLVRAAAQQGEVPHDLDTLPSPAQDGSDSSRRSSLNSDSSFSASPALSSSEGRPPQRGEASPEHKSSRRSSQFSTTSFSSSDYYIISNQQEGVVREENKDGYLKRAVKYLFSLS